MMVKAGCSNTSFRPQFLTELQPADLEKLKLPSQFMMHVEDENKNRLVASVWNARCKIWNIKLTRDQSEIFFKGNWPEFSKYHKLEVGFKLVFWYEGNMVFKVKVFGLNGCLKDYNQGVEAILRRIGFHASREKSTAKCASVTETSSSSGKQTKRKHDLVIEKDTPRFHNLSKMRKELGTTTKSYVKKKINKNLIFASPQTLETRMSHYSINRFMNLPIKFGSVPPYNFEKGEITLKNEKEETWKVLFNCPASRNNFCIGWIQFCEENSIKCRDICTFKIIAKNEILFTISKERIDDESDV